MMKITIWSHWAGAFGAPDASWTGDVPFSETTSTEAMLEEVFRYFNRVEEGDNARLEEIGYRLPSLSVGDRVILHRENDEETWEVVSIGFRHLG